MNLKQLVTATAAATLLSACASNAPAPQAPVMDAPKVTLPSWVTLPFVEDGFADTQCVENNAGMSVLKNKATALARAEIAKQIDIQVKAMDKTYQNLTEVAGGTSGGGTFESVSKQVTNQKLAGSRAVRMDYVDFPDNTQKVCVMVALNPALTQQLYKEIVQQSGRDLAPDDDRVLFQEFKAYKAQEELERELNK